MGIKRLFCIFKPIIPLLPISLHSELVKLGPKMTRSWEKGAQQLHVFSCNNGDVDNSQMCIKIWFHIWKWRILRFKSHLHSGLTRINLKTMRIGSKRAKECLNVARSKEPTCISQMGIKKLIYNSKHIIVRAREPTYISTMGIKKLFHIYKPIIPLLPNSLHWRLVNIGPKMTRS
jgi:hypothetical protein